MSVKWALIEAPIPNAPEGKYISQIPSPTNLLMAASALKSTGVKPKEMKLYNFLKERHPPMVKAPNIIFNLGEATCMDFLYNYAHEYLKDLSEKNPNSKIYLTGYHAWLHPGEYKQFLYPNIIYTEAHSFENDIIGKPKSEEVEWHNAWEINDWEWMEKNVKSKTKGIRATIRASRGCPHHCQMCPVLFTYGAKVRRYSIDWVLEEIDELYKRGARQIGFLDDNLMFHRKWAKELLRKIIDRNYKGLSLTFEEGLDVPTALDEELVALMKKAKFTHTKLGVESLNPATLKVINKPYQDPEQAIAAIKLLQKYKLSPVCFICIGFPTDTKESLKATIDKLKELKVKLRVQILWAYPGVTIQGQGLTAAELKEIQRDAMYSTGSCAWRKKPKK